MNHTGDSIGTFSSVKGLINQKIDLWDCNTAHTKDSTFPWRQEINRALLQCTIWIMNLWEDNVKLYVYMYHTCCA